MANQLRKRSSACFWAALAIAAVATVIFNFIDHQQMGRWALLVDMILFTAYFLIADLKSDDYGNR